MYRQQSSRNHRSKGGIKLKNVLQVCLILVVGVWLLYQIKHSHDKKNVYEEQFSNEIRKPSRKEVFDTVGRESKSEIRVNEEEKEEVEDSEKVDKDELIVRKEGEKENATDHEHEEASHEAREKSFKGDDVSSAVVHLEQVVPEHEEGSHESSEVEHNAQEVEHEEGSHEARERSFKGDDVSSAVDHKPLNEDIEFDGGELRDLDEKISEKEDKETDDLLNEIIKDSEGKNEDLDAIDQLDSFVESNSSFVHGTESSSEKKEPEIVTSLLQNNQSLTNSTRGEPVEGQLEQRNASNIEDQKKLQGYSINGTIDNQESLHRSSSNLSKDQKNVQMNLTALPEDILETHNNEKKTVDTRNDSSEQNQTTGFDRFQEPNDVVKIETSQIEKSSLGQKTVEQKPTVVSQEKSEENHNSSSSMTADDVMKEVLVESGNANSSSNNSDARKETHEHTDSSNLAGIQSTVKSGQKKAVQ